MNAEDIENQLPLTESTFFILLSLSGGKKHGYVIIKDVAELSDGRLSLGTGTLYGALGRLLDQGWIERIEEKEQNGRQRKVYILSELGHRILSAETARLQALVSVAQQQLNTGLIG